jgi:hypothetical protein
MEKEKSRKLTLKNTNNCIIQTVGTFLFVFFMMAQIIIFTTETRGANWAMPLFVLPASLICLTFGADYWVGKYTTRLRSYWISSIITTVLLVPVSVEVMSHYGTSTQAGFIETILLPVFSIIYGIWKERKSKKAERAVETKPQAKRFRAIMQKLIRVLCLLSICCVLLESWHRVITILYHFLLNPPEHILFAACTSFALSILSVILLARFIKIENSTRSASFD